MQHSNMVQFKKEVTNTHFFIYRGKQFPFNFNFFRIASNFFIRNEESLFPSKNIQLLDKCNEETIDIDDAIIRYFIQYVHQIPIPLQDDNAVILNFLGHRYEINELICCTEDYIASHQSDIVVDLLSIQQNDPKFDTTTYEKIISDNFLKYINEDNILKLKIPTIYRLLVSFKNSQKISNEQNEAVFNLLTKYLDKYGKEASVLFSTIDVETLGPKFLNLLMTKYSKSFDFNFINSNVIKTFCEKENEIILNLKKREIEQEEINQKLVAQISSLKKENDDRVNEIRAMNELNQKLAAELRELKEKYDLQIGEINKKMDEQKKEISHLKEKGQNRIEKLEKKLSENEKEKEKIKIESIPFTGNRFCGILTSLGQGNPMNALNKGIIDIKASSTNSSSDDRQPKNVLNYENDTYIFHSDNHPDSWLCIDFLGRKVKPSHYSMKSHGYGKNNTQPQNWDLQGSNDYNLWDPLDSRRGETCLSDSSSSNTFEIRNAQKYYRYLRIQQKGKNTSSNDCFVISSIEFFGDIEK